MSQVRSNHPCWRRAEKNYPQHATGRRRHLAWSATTPHRPELIQSFHSSKKPRLTKVTSVRIGQVWASLPLALSTKPREKQFLKRWELCGPRRQPHTCGYGALDSGRSEVKCAVKCKIHPRFQGVHGKNKMQKTSIFFNSYMSKYQVFDILGQTKYQC